MRQLPTLSLVVLVSACAAPPALPRAADAPSAIRATRSPLFTPTPAPQVFELPAQPGFNGTCAGLGIEAELHGDPDDPRVTWIVERGTRMETIWPPGYTAQFTPDLVVFDAHGDVVAVEGDETTGLCEGGRDPSDGVVRPVFDE